MTATTIISYNLRKGRASDELPDIQGEYRADILCLQECDTETLPETIDDLILAHATDTNRLGIAIYYDKQRFTLIDSNGYPLKKSIHDRVLSPADERLLAVLIEDNTSHERLVIASFHAAPLSASNALRRKQIKAAQKILQEFGDGAPIIMAGDYNYPLFKNKLKKMVEKNGFDLALSDEHTYSRWIRGHFDFVTSSDMDISSIVTLPKGSSDHRPIMITCE